MNRRKVLRLFHRLILCLIISALFWSWIFNFLTDTSAEQKIVIYADMKDLAWKELSVALEENAPEGIRLVQVHPFSYAMINSDSIRQADLYIMTEAQAEEYADWISPDGEKIRLFTAKTGEGTAKQYLHYEEQPGEDWYLYPGKESLHAGKQDQAALKITDCLLAIP